MFSWHGVYDAMFCEPSAIPPVLCMKLNPLGAAKKLLKQSNVPEVGSLTALWMLASNAACGTPVVEIPSLVKKFHDARQANGSVTVWGDGSAHRDFLYIKDCSRALHVIMDHINGPVNLATGTARKIRDVVEILAEHAGMKDHVVWDTSKPSGYLLRAYDVSRLQGAGFRCQYTLEQALRETYDWYASHSSSVRH